jgi:hypothetical protein
MISNVNCKGCGITRSWSILRYCPRGTEEVEIADLGSKILTRDLLNKTRHTDHASTATGPKSMILS